MEQFPSITEEELQEASQAILNRAIQAPDLHPWQYVKYMRDNLYIRKEYKITDREPVDLETEVSNVRPSEVHTELRMKGDSRDTDNHNEDDDDDDDDDDEVVRKSLHTTKVDCMTVEFCICWSPTYCVPVLWFTLVCVPPRVSSPLEAVYQYLVPEATSPGLRQIGVMGGISVANHPVSDLPAFFIHPCRTAEALNEICRGRIDSAHDYLMVWLGLVGPAVDLYVPSQLLYLDVEKEGAPSKAEQASG